MLSIGKQKMQILTTKHPTGLQMLYLLLLGPLSNQAAIDETSGRNQLDQSTKSNARWKQNLSAASE